MPAVPLSAHAPTFDPRMTTSSLMTTPTMSTIRPPVVAFSPATSLLGQLPPIQRFIGEDAGDGETFQEWHEQFESVAQLAGWTDQGKLVNLTTRLKGTAYSFYRSCSPEQRNSYPLLVVELKRRFTPVRLTAIQTQLFHDRQQGAKETVDDYAQALRKLYKNAYSGVLRGGTEAEEMGQTVLANQFVAGLRPDLKTRVVGTEGKLEQLLLKARFEEAKRRELTTFKNNQAPPRKPGGGSIPSPPTKNHHNHAQDSRPTSNNTGKLDRGSKNCFNCGLSGHMMRACPYPKPKKGDKESHGRPGPATASIAGVEKSNQQTSKRIEELRNELHEAELAAAVDSKAATIRNIEVCDGICQYLGPTFKAKISVNGVSTEALIDTGSPATIISLEFVMAVLAEV